MSGGHFDYNQWKLRDIADNLETYIYGESLDEDDVKDFIKYMYLTEDERNYIVKNKHTIPNRYGFNKDTIKEFKKGLSLLRQAFVYTQRIDWLLSGDDGEETFHERLKEDLETLKEYKP